MLTNEKLDFFHNEIESVLTAEPNNDVVAVTATIINDEIESILPNWVLGEELQSGSHNWGDLKGVKWRYDWRDSLIKQLQFVRGGVAVYHFLYLDE